MTLIRLFQAEQQSGSMPVHILDVTNADSPYVYYQHWQMIAHKGRLYSVLIKRDFHQYMQCVATEPPSWSCSMSPYFRLRTVCLMRDSGHYIIASELSEYFDGFAAKSHLLTRIRPALRTIQRVWRFALLRKRMRPLFVDALSKRPQTWLQGAPADILMKIQTLVLC